MTLKLMLAAALATGSAGASAATLTVGAHADHRTLADAARAARDGDTIAIAPGLYEGARFGADRLTIRAANDAPPGSVVVRGAPVMGKALLVIGGDDVTVSGLAFEGARVPDGNGAGIRAEGRNLTVRDSRFSGNEMGILTNNAADSSLTVRHCEFTGTRSQRAGHVGHAVYAGSIARLVVTGSHFARGAGGHYIKSRAHETVVSGNRIDDSTGSASYLIDLPQGGAASITDNLLVKGADADNCCTAIAYGFEMKKGGSFVNAPGPVRVSNNRFVNRYNGPVTFFANRSAPANPVVLVHNTLIAEKGSIVPASGAVTVDGTAAATALWSNAAAFAEMALRPPQSAVFALLGLGLAGLIVGRRKAAAR